MLDKTIKEVCLTDVAIPNGHNLHSTITENFQKYADLEEQLTRMRYLKTAHVIPPVLSTAGTIRNKLHDILKLRDIRPALCIRMQKAVVLDTCRIVRKFLAER